MSITVEQAKTQLELYLAAERAVLSGQSYKIGDREVRRADLAEIRAGISDYSGIITTANSRLFGRRRTLVPRG